MSIHVCVTGGTGFVASHLVYQLLLKGYHVHTTIRDLKKKNELIESLLQYHKKNSTNESSALLSEQVLDERLSIFEADLMKEGSFSEVIKGCRFVHHVASPYKLTVKDAQMELVDPAVKGTLNILNECIKLRLEQSSEDHNRLQRIIITSSIVAICDTAEKDKIYTEDDWNELSTVDRNPYFYSKVSSEKAAWKLMKEMQTKHGEDFIEMATICPSGVIGKPILPQQVNQSHDIVAKILNGEMPALIDMHMTFVDVKDVAFSHLKCMELDMDNPHRFLPSKEERFISCGDETISIRQVCEIIKKEFPERNFLKKLPTLSLEGAFGSLLVKGIALFQPKGIRQGINSNLGKPSYYSNKKIKQELGLTEFIGNNVMIRETVEHLLKINIVKD